MNLMLFGTSCAGKTTFMNILSEYGYHPVPTGDITRFLYKCGCKNMPVIVQAIVGNLQQDSYCFDHFYIHTMEQLRDITGEWPVVIHIIDKRSGHREHGQSPDKIAKKQARFDSQLPVIMDWLNKHSTVRMVTVYNTDYGFDMSELIEYNLVPYDTLVMRRP